jgi:predicted RNase H-like nuclease
VGFDSAWTPGNRGAIVALVVAGDGSFREVGPPEVVNFGEAERRICDWQDQFSPNRTLILLDQPTIVVNTAGQRPVEGIVCPSISLRLGGMQPSSQSRVEMFGAAAPVWAFLRRFGGAADPLHLTAGTQVIETYPVLALIALKWLRNGGGLFGALPKYNPQRRKTFTLSDWRFVCECALSFFASHSIPSLTAWLTEAAQKTDPKKNDQDCLDACLCLLVAVWLQRGHQCIMAGNLATGYMVVPHEPALLTELASRCKKTGRAPMDWLKVFCFLRDGRVGDSKVTAPLAPERGVDLSEPVSQKEVLNRSQHSRKLIKPAKIAWDLPKIAALLNRHRQRATYGAVAGIVGILPLGLMNGRSKSQEYSWIVAASGRDRGKPTGYDDQQMHPECRRQIREGRPGVITGSEELLAWLQRLPTSQP